MTLGGKRRLSRACLAWCALVVLVLGGCGGGGSSRSASSGASAASAASARRASPAKRAAAYRQNANALCDAMRDRLRHLGPAPAVGSGAQAALLPKAGRYYRGREASVSRTLMRLSSLSPPPGERPAIRRLERTMRRTDVLEQNQYRSALRGFRPGFLRASMALRPELSAERKAAGAAHLQACALGQSR